jgi:dCMP deaminase
MITQPLRIPSWDETFMHDVYWWARRSKDPRTKYGALLVRWEDKLPVSHAYNGFARGVDESIDERWERPEKFSWITHAESNAVLNCASDGRTSKGTILYTQSIPCCNCASDIIQGKIAEVVVHKQWQDYEKAFDEDKWNKVSRISIQKFAERGIPIRVLDLVLGVQGVLDGHVIDV